MNSIDEDVFNALRFTLSKTNDEDIARACFVALRTMTDLPLFNVEHGLRTEPPAVRHHKLLMIEGMLDAKASIRRIAFLMKVNRNAVTDHARKWRDLPAVDKEARRAERARLEKRGAFEARKATVAAQQRYLDDKAATG